MCRLEYEPHFLYRFASARVPIEAIGSSSFSRIVRVAAAASNLDLSILIMAAEMRVGSLVVALHVAGTSNAIRPEIIIEFYPTTYTFTAAPARAVWRR